MNFFRTHLLLPLFVSVALFPTIATAANGVKVGDVSILLGDTKNGVTEAVLASKKNYSLQGGSEDTLTILDAQKSLAAFVQFRNQLVIGIELFWSAKSAAEATTALTEATRNLIGDSGSLSFNLKPDPDIQMRLSSGNVTIDIRPIRDDKNRDSGSIAIFTTVGEHRDSIR